ncbi:MAG: hypothetical protein Q9227_000512 [Pyrenula ochraceoflavens]
MLSKEFQSVPAPSHSIGRWLPKDRAVIKKWLAKKLEELDEQDSVTLDPSITALQDLVAANPYLTQLAQDMFIQIPPAYVNDPTGEPQVRDFQKMLELVNMILKQGPQWFHVTEPPTAMGLIGFPINAILDWPMGTLAGFAFFLDSQVNSKWQDILNTWGQFLASSASLECLNKENGWLSADALTVLAQKGNDGKTSLTFQQLYACDPTSPNFGFQSWDAFFTRKFNPGVRRIAYPDDKPTPEQPDPTKVIVNSCESTPLQLATQVKMRDIFWLKQQPYSLADMLNNDSRASQFVGGTVYQAFLSALSYHCWHAPVSGTVVGVQIVDGTYYSENLDQGFYNPNGADPNAPNNSQPYISAVATRGIIFIQAKNPQIGLMAVVFIGMAEVSSCEFFVKEGDAVKKGDLIGAFHFGGSTHCMVFRPETNLQAHNFVNPPPWDPNAENNTPVCSALAVLTPPSSHSKTG